MKYLNKEIGNLGEELSKTFLIEKGYKIIAQNYLCPLGEIDIIAFNDKYLCFIEVKTRYSSKFGLPLESITLAKQQKLIKSAQYFICKNNLHNSFCRFDAIEVTFNYQSNTPAINHLQNIFFI